MIRVLFFIFVVVVNVCLVLHFVSIQQIMSYQSAPFGDQNPFADPSLQNARPPMPHDSVDDYNPFSDKSAQVTILIALHCVCCCCC